MKKPPQKAFLWMPLLSFLEFSSTLFLRLARQLPSDMTPSPTNFAALWTDSEVQRFLVEQYLYFQCWVPQFHSIWTWEERQEAMPSPSLHTAESKLALSQSFTTLNLKKGYQSILGQRFSAFLCVPEVNKDYIWMDWTRTRWLRQPVERPCYKAHHDIVDGTLPLWFDALYPRQIHLELEKNTWRRTMFSIPSQQ